MFVMELNLFAVFSLFWYGPVAYRPIPTYQHQKGLRMELAKWHAAGYSACDLEDPEEQQEYRKLEGKEVVCNDDSGPDPAKRGQDMSAPMKWT